MEWILSGFRDPKTTVVALIGFLAVVLQQFGYINITPDQQSTIAAFVLLLIGWFASDGKPKRLDG